MSTHWCIFWCRQDSIEVVCYPIKRTNQMYCVSSVQPLITMSNIRCVPSGVLSNKRLTKVNKTWGKMPEMAFFVALIVRSGSTGKITKKENYGLLLHSICHFLAQKRCRKSRHFSSVCHMGQQWKLSMLIHARVILWYTYGLSLMCHHPSKAELIYNQTRQERQAILTSVIYSSLQLAFSFCLDLCKLKEEQ